MWAEDIDDITVDFEEDGIQVVRQEKREVIARGTWPVLLFAYRERDPKTGEFGGLKFSLRKFRKQRGVYRMESKFNIGNPDQAGTIARTLGQWAEEASMDPAP